VHGEASGKRERYGRAEAFGGADGAHIAAASGMRPLQLQPPSFAVGFTLGLVLTGVTIAIGRVMRRRAECGKVSHPVIDGAKPINPVDLTVGPPIEPGAGGLRLESEIEDPPVNSQRW